MSLVLGLAWVDTSPDTHTRTHMHTHAHTRTHMHTHAHTHTKNTWQECVQQVATC